MARRLKLAAAFLLFSSGLVSAEDNLPNIVWLVSEDHGPQMGCYGDAEATTPHVDELASTSLRYLFCWSNAPVCAPARSTLIAGMYATSTGGEHMRSMVRMAPGQQMYPQLLRNAGYYCTNNSKEDYNLAKPGKVWDESSKNAHWKKRPSGKPFFAVFNSEKSHESKLRLRPHKPIHDPARVRIPAYHPDTPEVRQDWAQYYDTVTEADADAGQRLRELREAGLADNTIVFYFADHGSGMPRNKRWPLDCGLHVPLVVHIPEKFRHLRPHDYVPGGTTDRLVSFVDFAPTLLSLAGVKPPEWMQGQAFLGPHSAPPRKHLFGYRGRMDERYDLVRSVTDGRYVYVRQYLPHLPYGQHVSYMFQTPTTQVWKRLHEEGKLNREQDSFWLPKPAEELYDLKGDRDEVHNLADSAEHKEVLERLRTVHREHLLQIRDVGLMPEGERFRRANGDSPYELARDERRYPLEQILTAAEVASGMKPDSDPFLKKFLRDEDSAVRYWGVMGIRMRGRACARGMLPELRIAVGDLSTDVEIAAAQILAEWGDEQDRTPCLQRLVTRSDLAHNDVFTAIAALNALDALGDIGTVNPQIRLLPARGDVPDPRYAEYVPRLLANILGDD